jgi:hypothetical protein
MLVFTLAEHEAGRPVEAFQRWLADLMQRVCLP